MKNFGILLTAPAAFIAAIIYRIIARHAVELWPKLRPPLTVASDSVLLALVVEWLLLAFRGAVGTRLLLGTMYYPIHSLLFLPADSEYELECHLNITSGVRL